MIQKGTTSKKVCFNKIIALFNKNVHCLTSFLLVIMQEKEVLTMKNYKYLDKSGTFEVDNPELTSYLYLPLCNEEGIISYDFCIPIR